MATGQIFPRQSSLVRFFCASKRLLAVTITKGQAPQQFLSQQEFCDNRHVASVGQDGAGASQSQTTCDSRALKCKEGHTKGAAIGNPAPAPSPMQ